MSSVSKQQKRAKRAKTKAKQARVARQNTQQAHPIVPDYFMPDFLPDEEDQDIDDDLLLESYMDPEILDTMDDEERQALKDLMKGDPQNMPTENEMLLWEVFDSPAPPPSAEQRIAHYEELKRAEAQGQDALLIAFARGPIAAHALHNIDFDEYDDILVNSLGGYWMWAHGVDEETVRARIVNEDFYEAFREALGILEDESIMRLISGGKKSDESEQD